MKKRYFQFMSILKNHNCASVEFSVNKQNGTFNFAHVSTPKYHMMKPASWCQHIHAFTDCFTFGCKKSKQDYYEINVSHAVKTSNE